MSCVLVDEKELENIKNSKYISSGEEGCCYLYNNLIFKLYHNQIYNRKVYFDLENSNHIAFPEDILIDINTKTILGYTMKLFNGTNLKNGFSDNESLSELKKAYIEIKKELENFSYIDMGNISLTNILFDGNNKCFNLIDTSLWKYGENLTSINIQRMNYMLIKALSFNLDWNRYPLNCEQILFDLYGMHLNGNSYFLEFLTELEIKVSNIKQDKVKTIKDLKI